MTTATTTGWLIIASLYVSFFLILYLLFFRKRGWNRRAKATRRLLVEEDGRCVWRTLKGKVLVGWCDSDGTVSAGSWSKSEDDKGWGGNWAVIQTAKGKLVVYCFDKRVDDGPKTGVIQVYGSWRELEAAVPPNIFEEALLSAGIKKPDKYGEAAGVIRTCPQFLDEEGRDQ